VGGKKTVISAAEETIHPRIENALSTFAQRLSKPAHRGKPTCLIQLNGRGGHGVLLLKRFSPATRPLHFSTSERRARGRGRRRRRGGEQGGLFSLEGRIRRRGGRKTKMMVVQFFFSVAALVGGFFRLTHGEQGETYFATSATSAGPSRSQGEARRGQGNWHYPLHLTITTLPSSPRLPSSLPRLHLQYHHPSLPP
jgi:hypothetical protein